MSAQKSGTQDFSGASDVQKTRTYNTRSNPKGVDNKNDSFDGYVSASSRKDKRKANPKPPVVPNNRRVFAAGQEQLAQPQPQVVITSNSMDLDLDTRPDVQAASKTPEDTMADIQKRAEIQAAVRDALKGSPPKVTSNATQDHMIIDDDSNSDKGKTKEGTPQQVNVNAAGSSVLTPVNTEPPKQRIILNRSQRFRIYALSSAFQAPNFAQIKKGLQEDQNKIVS